MKEEFVVFAKQAIYIINEKLKIRTNNRGDDVSKEDLVTRVRAEIPTLTGTIVDARLELANIGFEKLQRIEAGLARIKTIADQLNVMLKSNPEKLKILADRINAETQTQLALKRELIAKNSEWSKVRNEAVITSLLEDAAIKAKVSLDLKAGNCDEMSTLAFFMAKEKNISPRELVTTEENADGDAHQFLVLGRKDTDLLGNPSSWCDDAVVCDPWLNSVFDPKELPGRLGVAGYSAKLRSSSLRDE